VGCRNLGKLPQLGSLIFFDKIFYVNIINHNLYGVEISAFFYFYFFLGDCFENFSTLEVEIGRNEPGILGIKNWWTCRHASWVEDLMVGSTKKSLNFAKSSLL
jgi:hypothetical protein